MRRIKRISYIVLMVLCLVCVGCSTNYTDKVSDICKDNEWEYESIKFISTNIPDVEYYGLHIQADGQNFEFYECDSKKDAQKLYDELTEDAVAHPYINITENTVLAYDAVVIYGEPQELTEQDKSQIKDVFEKLEL